MKILDDLMSMLDFEGSVKDIRQGVFHTGVVTRRCGLAATLPRDALKQSPPLVKEPGALQDKSARDLARMAYSESILEAAIGIATMNSLLEVDESRCDEINAAELILEKGKGKRVAIVGHFPFIPRVKKHTKELWVIDKNPKEGDFTETAADDLIPQADVVALTGTSLTNHTMEHLLALCSPRAYVIILGDTAPLSPVFFEYGLDAVAGTKVIDTEVALKCVSEGANYRQIRGIRKLIMLK
ncbi:MAG: DUF364 domain-containing protein [Deltaproteobacteria bacterium]|nr:DUF364 domain-containing protein [Deltaproteobacteria bacterium]